MGAARRAAACRQEEGVEGGAGGVGGSHAQATPFQQPLEGVKSVDNQKPDPWDPTRESREQTSLREN